MKFDFKLNTDAPGQHVAILVFAGALVFLSVVEAIKSDSESDMPRLDQKRPYAESGETLYQNPQLTWYERHFCRGYQRSTACSYRLLHPFKEVLDENGINVKEAPPAHNSVVFYKGPLPSNRAFSGHISMEGVEE
jgi:hypothetical protein